MEDYLRTIGFIAADLSQEKAVGSYGSIQPILLHNFSDEFNRRWVPVMKILLTVSLFIFCIPV